MIQGKPRNLHRLHQTLRCCLCKQKNRKNKKTIKKWIIRKTKTKEDENPKVYTVRSTELVNGFDESVMKLTSPF